MELTGDILAIDPGTHKTGWAFLMNREPHSCGIIAEAQGELLGTRLSGILDGILALIEQFKPAAIVYERGHNFRNAETGSILGMVEGVVLIAAARSGLPAQGLRMSEWRKAALGNGAASKDDAMNFVESFYGKAVMEDAAEAVCIGLGWIARGGFEAKSIRAGEKLAKAKRKSRKAWEREVYR